LIALAKLERLDLPTALFTEVLVPEAVAEECTGPRQRTDARAIGEALDRDSSYRRVALEGSRRLSAMGRLLDPGEAQALVLAQNRRLPVLMDERRGRLEAGRIGVEVLEKSGELE
jgi:predicted nucleic acid-binding protein